LDGGRLGLKYLPVRARADEWLILQVGLKMALDSGLTGKAATTVLDFAEVALDLRAFGGLRRVVFGPVETFENVFGDSAVLLAWGDSFGVCSWRGMLDEGKLGFGARLEPRADELYPLEKRAEVISLEWVNVLLVRVCGIASLARDLLVLRLHFL
jgi:hypothetical protein